MPVHPLIQPIFLLTMPNQLNLQLLNRSSLVTVLEDSLDVSINDIEYKNGESRTSKSYLNVIKMCDNWINNLLPDNNVLDKCNTLINTYHNNHHIDDINVIHRFMSRELNHTLYMLNYL